MPTRREARSIALHHENETGNPRPLLQAELGKAGQWATGNGQRATGNGQREKEIWRPKNKVATKRMADDILRLFLLVAVGRKQGAGLVGR